MAFSGVSLSAFGASKLLSSIQRRKIRFADEKGEGEIKTDKSNIIYSSHNLILPAAYKRLLVSGQPHFSVPFCLHLQCFIDMIHSSSNQSSKSSREYHVRLSFFDLTYKQFFGKTWIGPNIASQKIDKNKLSYNEIVYFHTTLKDEGILLIVELVCCVDNSNEKKTLSQGWSFIRIFKHEETWSDQNVNTKSVMRLDLMNGTPRSLLFLEEPLESNFHQKHLSGCRLMYTIAQHSQLMKLLHLFPENVILRANEHLPGIAEGSKDIRTGRIDYFQKPKLLKKIPCSIEKLQIYLPPSLEEFEDSLCHEFFKERLNKDNCLTENNIKVAERRLQIGIHNGWCYIHEPDIFQLTEEYPAGKKSRSSSRPHSASSRDGATFFLLHRNPIHLQELIEDPNLFIVFVLEYMLTIPVNHPEKKILSSVSPVQSHRVPVRFALWSPFRNNNDGTVTVSLCGGPSLNPDLLLFYRTAQFDEIEESTKAAIMFTISFQNKIRDISSKLDETLRLEHLQASNTNSLIPPSPPAISNISENFISNEALASQFSKQGISMLDASNPISNIMKNFPSNTPVFILQTPNNGLSPAFSYPAIPATPMQFSEIQQTVGIQHQNLINMRAYPLNVDPEALETSSNVITSSHLMEVSGPLSHAPLLAIPQNNQSGQRLSRAAYAKLYSAGFPVILNRHKESPEIIDPLSQYDFDVIKEEKDPLQCNEIVLQFLAMSQLPNFQLSGERNQGTIFFTFQFYRFPQVITERLLLEGQTIENSQDCLPCILRKFEKNDVLSEKPGYQIRYELDPRFLKPGESKFFMDYLRYQSLHIDVWDGTSLLLIGSCAVELKHLCRQGREGVEITYELDIIASSLIDDDSCVYGNLNNPSNIYPAGINLALKGKLHLKLANIGHPVDITKTGTAFYLHSKRKLLVSSENGNILLGRNAISSKALAQKKVTVAHPLAKKDRQLASALVYHQNKVNGEQTENTNLDSERIRKLNRMSRIRTILEDNEQPNIHPVKFEKIERNRDLKLVKFYREQSKKESISNLLSQAMTSEHIIYPSLGSAEFFEYELTNPFYKTLTVMVTCQDPELRLITQSREWLFHKQLNEIHTPVEDSMFLQGKSSEGYQILLHSREKVCIGFCYQTFSVESQGQKSFISTSSETKSKPVLESKIIKVYFKMEDNKILNVLSVLVEPQPHIIDQIFRFYQPEHSFLKKSIRVPSSILQLGLFYARKESSDNLLAKCSDPDVVCDVRKNLLGPFLDVFFKVSCGASPSIKQFYILLFKDKYLSQPALIWQVCIHLMQRVDVSCVVGQKSKMALILRGTSCSQQVQCFTSHPAELYLSPNGPFMLLANSVQEIQLDILPVHTGMHYMQVNVVDIDLHQLRRCWLICVSTRQPHISKVFELFLPVGGGKKSNKRISYTNPYNQPKTFTVKSNRPDLLSFKENQMEVGGGQSYIIGLRFLPCQNPGIAEIFVFINDEHDKNEETFCIKATYS